jgi:hypothetical protein
MKTLDPELRDAMECPAEQITSRIAGASEAALHGLLLNPGCSRDQVLRILQRRPLPESVLRRITESGTLISNHRIRAAVANHPSTEASIGLQLLGFLYWRDLARVASNPHVKPLLRRKAERILVLRCGDFTLGERIALARIAPRGVIGQLRKEQDPAVIRALLDNARLTEEDVLSMASLSRAPDVLRSLGEHHVWGRRYTVRMALLANRRIPVQTALRILPTLPARDVEGLSQRQGVPRVVRVAARRLLAKRPGAPAAGRKTRS